MKYDIGLVALDNPNYGARAVLYAHCKALLNMGFSVKIIGYGDNADFKDNCNFYDTDLFVQYNATAPDLLNQQCNMFMQGSDQQMNPGLYFNLSRVPSFDWVGKDKYKTAFGMSFARKENLYSISFKQYMDIANSIWRYDVIYTRGDQELEMINKIFGRICEGSIIDPVFLLSKQEWHKICAKEPNSQKDKEKYIFAYILAMTETKQRIIDEYAKKLGLKVKLFEDGYSYTSEQYQSDYSLECFFSYLKDANIVLTDSFHGTCLSVIFNKPFLSIGNIHGKLRFAIFEKLGLKDFRKETFEEAMLAIDSIYKTDWASINKNIDIEREKMICGLKHCAGQPKTHKVLSINSIVLMKIYFCKVQPYKMIRTLIRLISNFIPFKSYRKKFRNRLYDLFIS